MQEIMKLTETTETIQQTMTEIEALNQINENIVVIGNTQNLILGILILFGLYGMYKAICKLINMFF